MKILFKLDLNVETVHNISVDDKCFPVIGGVHPYSSPSQSQSHSQNTQESPLIRESSQWFKTLALDAIYVDCDRWLIFWTSIQNDVGQEVLLRRQISKLLSSCNDFIPADAKPLFEDFTLFDFDASLKEMMGKCKEIAEKLNKKTHSTAFINSKVANLLHVYILPSINFTTDDLYALSRTRCLIEERVMRADSEISTKASAKHLLEVSLDNLKENLIQTYNFENESYIRTCDPKFLKLFLKKIEEDSTLLNLNLEAEQSKVNWAKDHPNEYCLEDIQDLQSKRNEVHAEVVKLIKVREALRNVLTRKEKVKKKSSKRTRPQEIESCFQSIFIEINRRWEIDVKLMDMLILDKVNISGAREATLSAILELQSSENARNSERSTQFIPFSDCHVDGRGEKSSNWLTLQERVCNALQDVNSASHKVFMDGCSLIVSQIDLALSEYHLVDTEKTPINSSCNGLSDLDNVDGDNSVNLRVNRLPITEDVRERRSGLVLKHDKKDDLSRKVMQKNHVDSIRLKSATLPHSSCEKRENVVSKNTLSEDNCGSLENLTDSVDGRKSALAFRSDYFSSGKSDDLSNCSYKSIPESVADSLTETSFSTDRRVIATSKQLALKDLTQSIDNLKFMIQDHFRDVINCLQTELDDLGEDTIVVELYIDRNELIWKAYERYFSEKVLSSLRLLYQTSLIDSITATYYDVSQTSKQDLLEGDKILSLFCDGETQDIDYSSASKRLSDDNRDTYSMARTVSDFSLNILDCSVKDLYALTNADSNDVFKRFDLKEELEESTAVSSLSSSTDSGASVKTSDLFGTEDGSSDSATAAAASASTEGLLATGGDMGKISTLRNTKVEELSVSNNLYNGDKRIISDVESKSSCSDVAPKRHLFRRINSSQGSDLLDRVLTPFMMQMEKCIKGKGILDKVRYLSKAIEGLNKDISKLYGVNHQSACDDIITMLIFALSHMPKDVFIKLYINLSLIIDILPKFLNGSLCEYNVVSLVASYDYLKNRNASQQIIRRDSADYDRTN